MTKAADEQTKGLKEQWEKTISQGKKLVEDVKSSVSLGRPEPNLFADIEAGKLAKYKDEAQYQKDRAESKYNDKVDDTADSAKATINKAEEALKQ